LGDTARLGSPCPLWETRLGPGLDLKVPAVSPEGDTAVDAAK
jgi:hypothetical protein